MILKMARPDQYQTGILLYQQAAKWLAEKQIDQWAYWLDPTDDRCQWVQKGFAKNEFYFLYQGNEIAGMFRAMQEDLLYWGPMPDAALYIHSLIVAPAFRGQKLGMLLLQEAEKLARSMSISKLRLDCVADNDPLCRYYVKQGFTKVFEKQMPHSKNAFFEKNIFPNYSHRAYFKK